LESTVEAFLISAGVVALAEVGDKTQLLSLALAAKYRRPVPIICGVLVATALNHAGAGLIGTLLARFLNPSVMNWVVFISFVLVGAWMLVPDRLDDERTSGGLGFLGIFGSTTVAFFIAEMGDKTQVATLTLAARFQEFVPVVLGTTLGMMLANVPVILLGHRFAARLPVKALHRIAAAIFIALGVWALFNVIVPLP
jgi:putative Ca2+/H+ antiporter (TMEM165/GDT1 family)